MEEELEEYNMLKEELVTVKSQECRQGKFRSTDGHTYRVESDVAKKYVTFLFGEEEEEPITHEVARRTKEAAKRAKQWWRRSLTSSTCPMRRQRPASTLKR